MRKLLEILLMPMARFCVRHGVTLSELNHALKTALLNAAQEQLTETTEQITSSRLSVMTGVHRKDSSKFLKGIGSKEDIVSPTIKVLGCWYTKKKYKDADGKPRAVAIGRAGTDFANLVKEISSDVHPHTVLCELQRLNLVKIENDYVTPIKSSFISSMNDEVTAQIIARDIDELMLCADENIAATNERPNHHTATIYDNIPKEYESELRDWINNEASQLHKKIREHVSRYDRDINEGSLKDSKKGTIRFAFGSFGRLSLVKGNKNDS